MHAEAYVYLCTVSYVTRRFSEEAQELRRRIDACAWIGPEIVLALRGVSCQIFILECKVKSLVAHYLVCWTLSPTYAVTDLQNDRKLSPLKNSVARRRNGRSPPGSDWSQPHRRERLSNNNTQIVAQKPKTRPYHFMCRMGKISAHNC